jgi:hypothetical protein
MSDQWSQYIIFLVLILFLIWSFSRRRRMGTPRVDAAIGILTNVNDNIKVMEDRAANWQSKKRFQTGGWKLYKDKVEFLDAALVSSLNQAFTLAEDFNARIDSARKNKVMATLQDMQVERLREPLTKSKEGLVAWLRANMQTELQSKKRRGFFGF